MSAKHVLMFSCAKVCAKTSKTRFSEVSCTNDIPYSEGPWRHESCIRIAERIIQSSSGLSIPLLDNNPRFGMIATVIQDAIIDARAI